MPGTTPQITPEQFWMTILFLIASILTLVVFGAWQFIRLSGRAEAIQQEAQRLINETFARQQKRIDQLHERDIQRQEQYDRLLENYTSLNLRHSQAIEKIEELESALEEQRQSHQAVSDELASTKKELAKSEKARGEMKQTIGEMQATIKRQEKKITEQDKRIADLEARLKAQGVQMEQITRMLADSEQARKTAEAERDQARRDYEALMADMENRIEAAVAAKVVELQAIITQKDAQIALLEAKLSAVLAEKEAQIATKKDVLPGKSVSGDIAQEGNG